MEKTSQGSFNGGKKEKQEQTQLWEIVAKIPGLVYQFRVDTKGAYSFTFISEGVKSFLGVTPNEVYANSALAFGSIHPGDLKSVVKGGSLAAKTLKQRSFLFRVKDPGEQSYKWVRATSQPDRMADGSVVWNGIMVDITQDKETEEGRMASALETNSELESFSYTVSHDLQTPLRSILGFSKILLSDYEEHLNVEITDYLKIIEFNAVRMSNLTKDLLSFSRLGKAAINYSAVNMDSQVKRAIDEISEDTGNYKVKITKHDLAPAMCDANLIKQVWLNLIGNAFKYSSKKDSPVVEIGMERTKDELIYTIKDNGTGFDMQHVNKLFAPFQRLHTQEDFEGSGIGLAIVHRIITKHGGRVWAEAKPGDGACFYFSLPVIND